MQYSCNICAKLQIDRLKTLGEIDYSNLHLFIKLRHDERKDGQTDGRTGKNIMPPDSRPGA